MGPQTKPCVFSSLFVAYILQVSSLHFAQATYICTAYMNVSFVDPQSNETFWRQEESGLYGQDSPKESVVGDVVLPEPIHGCELDTFYDVPVNSKGWIALIQRGHGCTFSEKINVAASKGAIAAVIFNEPGTDNRVIQMSHPGTGGTVAIMIGYIRGMEIVSLIKKGIAVTMSIEVGKQHGPWMSHYSVFFVSISFFVVTAATVGYFIFYSARRLNSVRMQNRKQKQLKAEAKKAIGQLLVRTLKQDDRETGPDADTCAVCIDVYKPGDVVVTLTCNHFFHKTCIEPWLLEHRTCPMCKCDILKALGIEQPDVEEASHQVPLPPDFRSFPSIPEDTRSETASSGYASVQGTEEHTVPAEETAVYETVHELARQNPDPDAVQVDIQPHYDNLAFEGDSQRHVDPRT
ncbi:E3 ubiquitin-protein ligase RNF128a isoform X1 [Megalops cyprinoides]|uniref:E3 ubiquitin-protein ligase RNF128a isoform X1 n=1 Tax=Megalops cyprinoides TaxID=118141 RepID=UPI0018640D89|nr:E3 ubiquitin-protein ligase RNF128a isoform X1 [Megalops cyprinoides]